MEIFNMDKLIELDKHGVYRKENGNLVILPVRRHRDWVAKGMEFISLGANVASEEVKKKIAEAEKTTEENAKSLIAKYGEEIINDLPDKFRKTKSRNTSKKNKP
jgi:translation elongation factor EF-Ts